MTVVAKPARQCCAAKSPSFNEQRIAIRITSQGLGKRCCQCGVFSAIDHRQVLDHGYVIDRHHLHLHTGRVDQAAGIADLIGESRQPRKIPIRCQHELADAIVNDVEADRIEQPRQYDRLPVGIKIIGQKTSDEYCRRLILAQRQLIVVGDRCVGHW